MGVKKRTNERTNGQGVSRSRIGDFTRWMRGKADYGVVEVAFKLVEEEEVQQSKCNLSGGLLLEMSSNGVKVEPRLKLKVQSVKCKV